jgi:hypothetical protein
MVTTLSIKEALKNLLTRQEFEPQYLDLSMMSIEKKKLRGE